MEIEKEGQHEHVCKSVGDLEEAATALLQHYPNERVFAFYGEMGAGKTTFIKAICEKLNITDQVSSPTFALINVYNTISGNEIYHFDFFRMESLEEVFDIGYEEYFYSGNFCFLEWPEKVEQILPEENIEVHIMVDKKDNSRVIRF